jgi:hypothetical protein
MLPNPARSHLDSIVQQMTTNKEPEKNIQAVVNDFKTKYDHVVNPIAAGTDPRMKNLPSTNPAANFIPELPKAVAQILLGNPVKLMTSGGEGAIAGFQNKPTATNKTYNVPGLDPFKSFQSDAVDRKKAGQGPVKNILQGGLQVGLAGLDTVAALDSASMAVKGAPKIAGAIGDAYSNVKSGLSKVKTSLKGSIAEAATNKSLASRVEVVSPSLNASEAGDAISKGESKTTGLFNKTDAVDPMKNTKNIDLAKATEGIVNPKKTLAQNSISIKSGIEKEAENLVKQIEKSNPSYRYTDLEKKLKGIEKPVLISSDATLNSAYDKVLNKMMDISKNSKGRISELLKSRKQFDNFVRQQFPNLYESDTLTPMKSAITNIRNEVNNFISDSVPDVAYKASLKKQSLLYEALDNVSTKAGKNVGKPQGTISKMTKKYPKITSALKYGTGALIGEKILKNVGVPIP